MNENRAAETFFDQITTAPQMEQQRAGRHAGPERAGAQTRPACGRAGGARHPAVVRHRRRRHVTESARRGALRGVRPQAAGRIGLSQRLL
jgi:hypothetical protein